MTWIAKRHDDRERIDLVTRKFFASMLMVMVMGVFLTMLGFYTKGGLPKHSAQFRQWGAILLFGGLGVMVLGSVVSWIVRKKAHD